jgi:ectoine hydroxylase-related dioxygenase (phytanoyl-CoA dioxygenase family)
MIDEHSAFFHDHGYVIVPDAVSPNYLGQLQETTGVLLRERPHVGTVRNLLALSPVFEGLIDEHAAFPLLEQLIGDDIQLLSIDMRNCQPGGGSIAWHVDLPFHSPRLISLNTALYLDDLTPENGALRIVPRSHHVPFRLPPEAYHAALPGEVVVECPAGTMVVFSDCLWHRTGENRTERPRRGIFTYYGHFWQKQCTFPESPEPFPRMRRFIDGKGAKRAQIMGLYRQGSEHNYLPDSHA